MDPEHMRSRTRLPFTPTKRIVDVAAICVHNVWQQPVQATLLMTHLSHCIPCNPTLNQSKKIVIKFSTPI